MTKLRIHALRSILSRTPSLSSHTRDRRADGRQAAWQQVVLHNGAFTAHAEIVELSRQGIRLKVRDGWIPALGTPIAIELLDHSMHSGVVVWAEPPMLGIQLHTDVAELSDFTRFEHLGGDFYQSIIRQQIARSRDKP